MIDCKYFLFSCPTYIIYCEIIIAGIFGVLTITENINYILFTFFIDFTFSTKFHIIATHHYNYLLLFFFIDVLLKKENYLKEEANCTNCGQP